MHRTPNPDSSRLETNNMQAQEQYPPPQDKLTPLPDFVTSYHNAPDPFGGPGATITAKTTAKHDSESLTAAPHTRSNDKRRLTRRMSSLHRQQDYDEAAAAVVAVSSASSSSVPSPDKSSASFRKPQYQSRRRLRGVVEPSEPIQEGSSDERRAMSDGMVTLLREKMVDLGKVMTSVQGFLSYDMEPGVKGNEVFDLAIKYLKQSDHAGPAGSKVLQRGLLRKVDSLGKLAKRLEKDIPGDVDRDSDLYDLRSYYRGHRGVDIYAGSGIARKKPGEDARPGTASEFKAALATLDPTAFHPDAPSRPTTSTNMSTTSMDFDEDGVPLSPAPNQDMGDTMLSGRVSTVEGADGSLAAGRGRRSSSSSSTGAGGATAGGSRAHNNNFPMSPKTAAQNALSLARQQLVRMQDEKRHRAVARRASSARALRNTLSRLAEGFAIRALPNPKLVYVPPSSRRSGGGGGGGLDSSGLGTPAFEVNSTLILGYVADSMRIVEGTHAERVFRNYFLSGVSKRAFALCLWSTYLRHFQHHSQRHERTQRATAKIARIRRAKKDRERRESTSNVAVAAAAVALVAAGGEHDGSPVSKTAGTAVAGGDEGEGEDGGGGDDVTAERRKLLSDLEAMKVAQAAELADMSTLLATTYVSLLSSIKIETHKPVFYRYYSTALAEAIYQTLYFYCPGSRNLYHNQFKRTLYQQIAETMSGMPIYPVSVSIMSAALFGSVIVDDNDVGGGGKGGKGGGTGGPERRPGEPLPAGHSTKPMRFPEPSIWIPPGKSRRGSSVVTHMSPLVRKFLNKPRRGKHLSPLPTKRTKPTTTRYRLPNAFKMIGLAEERMMELRANYNFKLTQFANDKRFDRRAVKEETVGLEKLKQRVLVGPANQKQRYAFKILDQHKKDAAKKALRL